MNSQFVYIYELLQHGCKIKIYYFIWFVLEEEIENEWKREKKFGEEEREMNKLINRVEK